MSPSGIVSIGMGDTDHLRQVAISHICHDDNGGGVLTILSDGTKRSTLAVATYGMHRPFSLQTNNEVLEELRRRVADLSVVFQQTFLHVNHIIFFLCQRFGCLANVFVKFPSILTRDIYHNPMIFGSYLRYQRIRPLLHLELT